MIVKRNFDPRKVTMYVWQQLVVALTALCRIIERDARATLGETDLPARLEPRDGYLW